MTVATPAVTTATFTVAVRNHRGTTEYFRGLNAADAKALHARRSGNLTTAEIFPTT